MPTPKSSDIVTRGIRVRASAYFLPGESRPEEGQFVFGYRIQITNEGAVAVKLISRHWRIIDAEGHLKEVRGPGVVGQTPTLQPGESFKYSSYCPLTSSWGTMEGTYQMESPDGEHFDAQIARFYLRNVPEEAHLQLRE